MIWYKRLRFRLIVTQIAVVVAGAGVMLIILRILIPGRITIILNDLLTKLELPLDLSNQILPDLNQSISRLILGSVGLAATIAFLVGIGFSMLVWWTVISPIRKMALSSQRVANGQYDERVDIPDRAGEAINQLAINFNQMAQTLESVEEQRVRLIGNMTHELRTPLTSLIGYVDGLGDGIFEPDQKLIDSMQKQLGRMKRLVDDAQELSQAESGEIQLILESINVTDAINQVIFQLAPNAQEKKHAVTFQEPEQDIYITADYDRLIQILLNLLANAIGYTPPEGQISFWVKIDKSNCTISIEDNGIGISAEDLPFVFERFYRVDQSRSRKYGGSGVGLTISRDLARQMGGDLTVQSQGKGDGSSFALTLRQS